MAAFSNSARDTFKRGGDRWQPEVEQGDTPPGRLALSQPDRMLSTRAGRLESKAFLGSHQISHPLDHEAGGRYRGSVHIER